MYHIYFTSHTRIAPHHSPSTSNISPPYRRRSDLYPLTHSSLQLDINISHTSGVRPCHPNTAVTRPRTPERGNTHKHTHTPLSTPLTDATAMARGLLTHLPMSVCSYSLPLSSPPPAPTVRVLYGCRLLSVAISVRAPLPQSFVPVVCIHRLSS